MKSCLFSLVLLVCAAAGPSQAASEREIYAVIRSGERRAIERLLDQGVPPDHRDAQGNTLLMRAALYGKAELLSVLLDRGADVNAASPSGATALMRAAGDTEKIQMLIRRGANVNARSALGNTPLILAARAHGSADAVRLLIERGAEVNATNQYGASAILTAAASGDLETVRLLLKHGADVNAHSRGSEAATLWGGGRSPLMWASARGDLAMIKLLLEAGARVNEVEGFGTALIQAAWMDQTSAARLLLENGADVHARDFPAGYTALHWAASSERNRSELVELLLEHGADASSEGGQEVDAFLGVAQTPLMLARKRGDTAITRALAAAGGKVNAAAEKPLERGQRDVKDGVTTQALRRALEQSVPLLERTALESKKFFLSHASKQDCTSCHQQYLPLMALASARRSGAPSSQQALEQILAIVHTDNVGTKDSAAEVTFHPEPGHSFAYALTALDAQAQPPSPEIDALVHHLLVIQGSDGQWHNNLPRPPLQTSDVAPTALAVRALTRYGFPARVEEIGRRIARAKAWLRKAEPANTEERAFQLLGLAWAGEAPEALRPLAGALLREQRPDGGWGQLPSLGTDAYATGQALVALSKAGVAVSAPPFQQGLAYLLKTQLEDGAWHVARRAFPFQPTMRSGFPHSRDSWISASGTSWAVMAIALGLEGKPVQVGLAR